MFLSNIAIGLTRCRTQTHLSLRQHGTALLFVYPFLRSQSAKKDTHRTYAVEPFCVTETRFACGSMVFCDHMFVVFALAERKNDKREKSKYHSAEGSERQLHKS